MKLIIHGGFHKTGTTSFQHWLADWQERLAREGVYVPSFGPRANHGFQLIPAIDARGRNARIWQRMEKAAEKGMPFCVISAEAISLWSADWLRRLYEYTEAYDPTLLFVVRHWYDSLPSHYVQLMRKGDWLTFDECLDRLQSDHCSHPLADFAAPFKRAEQAGFRNVVALNYGPDATLKAVLGMTGLEKRFGNQETGNRNRRHGVRATERLRLANGVFGEHLGLAADRAFCALAEGGGPDPQYRLAPRVRRWERANPDQVARFDEIIRDHIKTRSMHSLRSSCDRWHDELRAALSRSGTTDRLGADWHDRSPTSIEAGTTPLESVPADLRKQLVDVLQHTPQEASWTDAVQREVAERKAVSKSASTEGPPCNS